MTFIELPPVDMNGMRIVSMLYNLHMNNKRTDLPTHRLMSRPRVRGWMLGFYAHQIEQKKALSDIPLTSLNGHYLRSLALRAEIETRHLVPNGKI